jgi:RNA polymerase-binding transcription factor DksA
MATKKIAPKKVVKAAKPVAKPVKKTVPAKPQPKAKPAPVKAAKPVAKPIKKAAPAKPQPKAKVVPVKAAKPVPKPVKKAAPAKPQPKAKVVPVKAAKPVVASKPVKAEVVKPSKVKAIVKPAKVEKVEVKTKIKEAKVVSEKPVKVVPEKPAKVAKPAKPAKPLKQLKPAKIAVKVSGIEKATTVIPMKQKPMRQKEEPIKDVKIPKTVIKTSVQYNPGYTPLENRVSETKANSPMIRYGDNELNEFRELINKKLDAAKKELAYFQGLITRKDDSGGDNGDGRYMTMEDGSLSMEREQLSQMASRTITYIDHLEKAIMRIESKTYGVCRMTGKLIDKARLRAVPHATLSLEAKLGLVKPNSGE